MALTELDVAWGEPSTGAVVALQFRPTREVLERAGELCQSASGDERRLGVHILAELQELEHVGEYRPAFREESMDVLLGLAEREQDTDVLVEVARAFGYRRDPRALEPLLRYRDHPEQPMRFFVACSLRSCRTEDNEDQVVGALIELTNDDDGAVRDYALFGLRELEVDSVNVREAMLRRVRDPDSSAAGEALVGLAMLGDERGIEPLLEFLQSAPPDRVHSYGLKAASTHGDARLLSALRGLKEQHGEWTGLDEAIRACAPDMSAD